MKESKEGLTFKKDKDFSEWYSQVIQKAELAEYTNVSGCIVFRPRAYYIWETVQSYMNNEFKKIGVRNIILSEFNQEKSMLNIEINFEDNEPKLFYTIALSTP